MKAVMLMFDSLNREMLEPYGCDWVKTPNFRRLAEHCVQFEQCYAGSLPCMPARRELQTGRYNLLHRSWGPMEPFDDSTPELLKSNGIYTHLISDHVHYWEDGGATYHYRYNSWENIRGQEGDKWKCLPELLGPCEESKLQNKDGIYFYATQDLQRHDAVNRKFMQKEEETALAQTVNGGLQFIDSNYQCDKWFLQIECFDPHEPFYVPQDWKTEYDDTYENQGRDWPPYHHVTEDETLVKHYKYKYAELLEMCDKYLGKILDKFDELNMWKDTLLIVNTDHGYLLGEHSWWSKVVMPCYDEIAHIPLFIHDPRFKADGQKRSEIVQTIDIPATLLEFFGIERPKDMQGKPIRTVIEENKKIRDYALFGIHGAHVNIFDGKYVYMKAPVSEKNSPLYEYTIMPMHMRNMFLPAELQKAEMVNGNRFSFTKGCPVWKIPKGNGSKDFSDLLINGKDSEEAKHIDNNSMVNAANFGDKLFDLEKEPKQMSVLEDTAVEAYMANLLQKAMLENESPIEQFERIGLPSTGKITEEDIRYLHKQEKERLQPAILTDFAWTKGAINTYQALMKFIPAENEEHVRNILVQKIPEKMQKSKILPEDILKLVPDVIPEEYVDMVDYFVGLSGRTE